VALSLNGAINNFLDAQAIGTTNNPKAYINTLFWMSVLIM
jgi:hypothetical protein